jgi:two-component system nitrogen regulation response regulator NtrX
MPSILIIDDERSIRNVLKDILGGEGYKVDEAADGEEGWKKFSSSSYDVVLCDIKMPKMDGIEFLSKASELNPRGAHHHDQWPWQYRNGRGCR